MGHHAVVVVEVAYNALFQMLLCFKEQIFEFSLKKKTKNFRAHAYRLPPGPPGGPLCRLGPSGP